MAHPLADPNLWTVAGISSVGGGIVVVLAKTLLENLFARYRGVYLATQQVLRERRGEVIHETYIKLATLVREANLYITLFQDPAKDHEEKGDKLAKAIVDLYTYADDNRLLLDDKVFKSINKLIKVARTVAYEFAANVIHNEDGSSVGSNWIKLEKDFQERGNKLLLELRIKLRKIVGIKD